MSEVVSINIKSEAKRAANQGFLRRVEWKAGSIKFVGDAICLTPVAICDAVKNLNNLKVSEANEEYSSGMVRADADKKNVLWSIKGPDLTLGS